MISKVSKKFLSSTITKSTPKIIRIPYKDLVNVYKSNRLNDLHIEIQDAYGKDGLGALVIQDVPNHFEIKYKLLQQTHQLINLPKEELLELESPETNYALGWSHGKEIYEGVPDTMKGSYYAKLKIKSEMEGRSSTQTKDENKWPKYLPDLEPSFHAVGNQIREISFMMYDIIDNYIKSINPDYNLTYKNLIDVSDHNVGRILHYFPRGNSDLSSNNNWCGWHNDHGALTGLVSAMYFDSKNNLLENIKTEKTGLWMQARNGEYIKFGYGKNDIAFQLGESIQITSGGHLVATPHAVIIDDDIPADVHRSTLALFMQQKLDTKLEIPKNTNMENLKTADVYTVPKLQDRYIPGMTFGDFHLATLNKYYEESNIKV